MNYIKRTLEEELRRWLFGGKALILYGPRQSGKTTLIRHLVSELPTEDVLWLNPGFPPTHNEECHCGGMTSNAA